MSGRTVWVTGIGAVSAAGVGAAVLGEMLVEARAGVRRIPELDNILAGKAQTPPPQRAARHFDRSAQLFFAAGEEAWQDAGLEDVTLDLKRCAVLEGSSLGSMAELLTEKRARPSHLVRYMTGAGGAGLAQLHG